VQGPSSIASTDEAGVGEEHYTSQRKQFTMKLEHFQVSMHQIKEQPLLLKQIL
jgi:hypothetical protein